jgi:hypothetical protein
MEEAPMLEMPEDLLAAIPTASEPVARDWWAALSDAERGQVAGLWDDRREVHFFSPQADDAECLDAWEQVPEVQGGRFLPRDDAWGLSEWGPGYFEHLLQHPELVLIWEPAERTFHIGCTRHADARACLESGRVPTDFVCPLDSASCPLEPLSSGVLTGRCSRPAARAPERVCEDLPGSS